MGQTVKLRRSAVSGRVPINSQLQLGELSVNTADGKLFFAKSGSLGPSIEEIITTNTQNTGSIDLVGALTASVVSSSFIGDGRGLYNIPATGVTGLSLDKITSGPATASISETRFDVNVDTVIDGSLTVTEITGSGLGLTNVPVNISGSSHLSTNYDSSFTKLHFDHSTGIKIVGDTSTGIAKIYLDGVASENESGVGNTKLLTVTTASSTWTFNHGLGEKYPSIVVFDGNDNVIIPQNIEAVSESQLVVSFASPQIGYVTATVGGGLPSYETGDYKTLVTENGVPTWKEGILSGSISFDSYSSSIDDELGVRDLRLDSIESSTGSYLIESDLDGLDDRIDSLEVESGSIRTDLNTYTSSTDNRLDSLEIRSGSQKIKLGEHRDRLVSLELTSGSHDGRLDSIESKTGSFLVSNDLSTIEGKIGSLETTSGSHDGRLDSLETESGSIRSTVNTYTSSNNIRVDNLESFETTVGGGLEFTGSNVTIKGDLLVKGTETRVDSTTVEVSDNIISLNGSGAANGGIEVRDVTSPGILSGSLIWDGTDNKWKAGVKGSEDSIVLVGDLNSFTSSNDDRLDRIETSTSSLNSFTSSISTTIKDKLNNDGVISGSVQIDHDATTNYVGNEHIDHSTITIGSGKGLTGGGTIDTSRSLTLDTGSAHFLDGVKSKLNTETVVSGSEQIDITGTTNYNLVDGRLDSLESNSGSYLTEFTETDPIFTASPSAGITETNITNWDSAYTYSTVGHLPLSGGTITGDVRFLDDDQLRLGSGNDLRLWHNGTNSYLFNYGGSMFIGTRTNDTTFLGHDGSNGDTTYFKIDGSNEGLYYYKSQFFADGVKSHYGANNDLEIYHDGSNSYITEKGTGDLIISADNDLTFKDGSGNIMANMNASNSVELMFGNVKKFETTSTGISVSGTIVATGYNDSNWNTAYGWGDHSQVGYITGFTNTNEFTTGATFNSGDGVITFTRNNGGDTFTVDLDGRYLTSFTETDPIFMASPSAGITDTNISNWNTAYVWGDHSQVGYITGYNETDTLDSVTDRGANTVNNITTGIHTITKLTSTSGTQGTTLLELANNVGGDISQQQTFIDFKFTDTNDNWTPQVRIGAQVGQDASADSQNTEGAGAFVVYTGDGSSTSGTLNESLRVSYDGDTTIQGVLTATGGNSTQWNTAYGWGDHSQEGYITGFTNTNEFVTGATFNTGNGVVTFTRNNGGDTFTVDLDGRYLTSFTETDPIFTASPSAGITETNITNWDTAYGWGDHSTEGYLKSYNDEYTTGATFNGGNGIITFTRNDGDQYTVDISSTLTDITVTGGTYNDGTQTLTLTKSDGNSVDVTGFAIESVKFTTGATFNTGNGIITFKNNDNTTYTVDIDNRYLQLGGGTLTGNLTLNSVNPEILFNGTSDVGVDMAIKATPEGLDFYEPEDSNKIHFQILDDTGVNAVFGLQIGGTQVLSSSRVLTNVTGNISMFTNDSNYLTSFTETDPIFTASPSAGITDTNIENWNEAYGWGDHSQAGYVTSSGNTVIGTDQDINTSGSYVVDQLTMTDGVITNHSTRQLTQLRIPDTRTAEKSPNDYDGQHLSLDFTDEFGSLGSWYSGITLKGWTGTYAAWQLISEADSGVGDTNLYFRQGNNTTWQSMRTVWTSANFADNSSNWNTAYGWGDHSTEGYLTSFTETDPIFTASPSAGITDTNISNWNTAYGWGDHSQAGYTGDQDLSGYLLNTTDTFSGNLTFNGGNNNSKESFINVKRGSGAGLWLKFQTDSTSTNNVSQFVIRRSTDNVDILSISATSGNLTVPGTLSASGYNNTNWDTAYGWGDHSQVGYITGFTNTNEFTTGATFNSSNGVITFTRNNGGDTYTVDIDGKYAESGHNHDTQYLENSYVDVNMDTYDSDKSLLLGRNLGGWLSGTKPAGTHNGFGILHVTTHVGGYATQFGFDTNQNKMWVRSKNPTSWGSWEYMYTTQDFSTTDISNWNTAYGWGDHSQAGYITGFTNTNEFTTGATFNSSDGIITFTRNNGGDTYTVDLDGRYLQLGGGTLSGDLTIAKSDPTLTFLDTAGSNTNPNGQIKFSELNGTTNFELNYNGTNDRFEFRGLVGGVDSLLGYFARSTTDTFNVTGKITSSGGNSDQWNTAYGWGDHSQEGYITGDYLPIAGGTLTGNLIVGSVSKTSDSVVRVLADQGYKAGFEAYGNGQGTGYIYLGQSTSHGGGMSYNGDGSPALVSGESNDRITFYRRTNSVDSEVFSYNHNSDSVYFNGEILPSTINTGQGSTEVHLMNQNIRTTDDVQFGKGKFSEQVSVNNRTAMSVAHWSRSGNTTGAIKIKIPGTHTSNWSMLVLRITTYEYNSNAHAVYYVSGHDWTSGWYNNGVTVQGTGKLMSLGFSTAENEDYVILGDTDSTWAYGHVTVDVVAHPDFYNSSMDITSGWVITQETELDGITINSVTNKQLLDTSTFGTKISQWDTAYGWGNHADQDYATETYVGDQIDALIDSAPGTLDTLNELADALGDDPNFATTITNSIATKVPLAGNATITGTKFFSTNLSNEEDWINSPISVTERDGIGNGSTDDKYSPNINFHWSSQVSRSLWMSSNGDFHFGEYSATGVPTNSGNIHVSGGNSSQWNTAYGWGDHANAGYLTSSSTQSKYLRSDADDNFSGRLTNNTMNETPAYNKGAINLQPSTSGGSIGITFRSKVNSTSDAGYIWWYDNNDHYNELDSTENGVLLIAAQNDGGATSEDAIALESSGDIYLNAGVASGAIGSGEWNASRGNVFLGYAADRARVLSTDDGDPSQWNTAYGWGDHSTAGYTGDQDLSGYLLNSTDTFVGSLSINGDIRGTGQQLILNAGESYSVATAQTNEYVYVNAEQGLEVNSDTGNWSGGWAARKTALLRGDLLRLDGEDLTKTNIQNFKTAYGWGDHDGVYLPIAGKAADSEKLDGIDSSEFLRSNTADTFTSTITMGTQKALVANNYGRGVYGLYSSTRYQHVWSMGTAYNLSDDGTTSGNLYGIAYTHTNVGGQSKSGLSHQALFMTGGVTRTAIGTGIWTDGTITTTGHGNSSNWKSAYDWGNHASSGYLTSSSTLNASNMTTGTLPDVFSNSTRYNIGLIDGNGSQTRDKIRVWTSDQYTIGMKSGYQFGHLGNNYAMSFQMNAEVDRGFWWGTDSDTDNQGAMALTTDGRANIKKSLSIGQGNTTTPSSTPLYVEGTTAGATVFEVHGTQGPLFSISDDMSGDIFEVSDISGVPILTVNASGTVTVDDTLHVKGDVIAYHSSDKRLKDNIKPILNPLDKIKLIGGYEFDWNEQSKNEGHDVGVIAQEIEEVLPELVSTRNDGYKGVKYEKITALLIEANKELLNRVEELEKKLTEK